MAERARPPAGPPRVAGWADPARPLEERLLAAEVAVANRDTGDGRRAVMRELVEAELARVGRQAVGLVRARLVPPAPPAAPRPVSPPR